MVDWYLGTMGFSYKQWSGAFYPAGMTAQNYLSHYSQLFNAVEIDSSFYGPPSTKSVKRWAAVTPSDFTFCLKVPRTITHELRLLNAIELMISFLDTTRLLGNKLGVILIQFPPDFTYDHFNALMAFLKELPTDIQYAIEFRHRSWNTPGTAALLEKYNISQATVDSVYMPKIIRPTADFLYLRFIGPRGRFPTKDREIVNRSADLKTWYQHLQPHLERVSKVYGFFNDDYSGHSPITCSQFKEIVGIEQKEIRPWQQKRLF